jgi:hypothetical protein
VFFWGFLGEAFSSLPPGFPGVPPADTIRGFVGPQYRRSAVGGRWVAGWVIILPLGALASCGWAR